MVYMIKVHLAQGTVGFRVKGGFVGSQVFLGCVCWKAGLVRRLGAERVQSPDP